MRQERIALDDAGVAVGRLLARTTAVDQCYRKAALGEMESNRGADDAGAEHDGVGIGHGPSLSRVGRLSGRACPAKACRVAAAAGTCAPPQHASVTVSHGG